MPVKTKMASCPRALQGVKVCAYFLLPTTHLRSVLACSLEFQNWEGPRRSPPAQPTCFREERRGKGARKESPSPAPGFLRTRLRSGGDFHFIDLKTEALNK